MPDINDIRANFASLEELRKKYPHLKTILSIGGWTYSVNFSDVAADATKTKRFVDSAYQLMSTYNFDGIDIDWEVPVEGGNNINHRASDKENFTSLLQALRNKIGSSKLLTIAAPPRPKHHQNLEISKIANIVDWINLMAYDYHGPWGGSENSVTNFNAPLYADYTAPIPKGVSHDLNIDASVQSLLKQNLPSSKLVLGLSFYGRAFSGVEPGPNNDGLYQAYSGYPFGTWPDEKGRSSGVYDYWDLYDNYIGKEGWSNYYNYQAGAAWLYNPSKKIFIGYDSPKTIFDKCAYLASLNLGGAMIWEASNDRYNQLLYVVNNTLNEGGLKSEGQLVQLSAHFNKSTKQVNTDFEVLQDLSDSQLEGTPLQFKLAGGYAYAGHYSGSVSMDGINLSMQSIGLETPHLQITAGSVDFTDQVSLDGGFTYAMGLQFASASSSLKIGNPDNPAVQIDYEGPSFGFYNEIQYQKGNLKVGIHDTLIDADFSAGNKGFVMNCSIAEGFSETLEIDSQHFKIALDGNGFEINKDGIGFFFGYGPFTITIHLINPIVLAEHIIEDLYKIGKAIWNASFKIFLAYKNFVTGVVKAVKDIMDFLFK